MLNETKAPPAPFAIPREFTASETPVYITKSNFFRVIHVDGFFGGGTPTPGNIMMTVYNQRVPLPEKAFLDFMGNEILSRREAKIGIEHEYEASLLMSLATAKAMQAWLNNAISQTELLMQQMQQVTQRNQQK